MNDLQVVRADPADPRWHTFVRAHPDATIAHLPGWTAITRDVLGGAPCAFAAVDDAGEWQGLLPLVRLKTPLLGHWLISMPYLNYGGAIGTSEAVTTLARHAVQEAEQTGAGRVQLRNRIAANIEKFRCLDHKILVLLDLPETPDALWSSFPSKLRSQIRRPEKEGMRIEFGSAHIDAFYDVFARNMRDLGTPVYSRRFFREIAATFPEAVFAAVYHGDVAVGAACGFLWRDEFEITWASTIRDYNSLSPNMLLYWGCMREMISRGARVFNFGRSSPDGGTHRFKRQWGGVDAPLPWLEWPGAVDPAGDGQGRPAVMSLAASAWQRMPLAITNRLGPPIAARLPWW